MPTVTVTGANNTVLTVQLNGVTNYTVAQQFAAMINSAAGAGVLTAFNVGPTTTTPALPAGNVGEAVVLTAQPPVAMPAGYVFLTDNATVPTTVTGSASGFDGVLSGIGGINFTGGAAPGVFVAGGGPNVFNGGSGAYYATTGDGADTINTGGGNDTVDPGTGANVVTLGTGTNIVLSSSTDSITGGTGTSTIFLSGAGATVNGAGGALDVASTGTRDAVTLGSGGGTIFGGTGSTYDLAGAAVVIGSVGANTINAGLSAATVFAGGGNELVNGPAAGGSLLFIGGAGSSTVVGGAAPVTLFGSAGGSITFTGSTSGNLLDAGTGTLLDASGSTGADVLEGGLGANTLLGGTGADTYVLGSGATTLTGGTTAANLFDFVASATGGATDVITDFKTSDKLALTGYAADTAAGVLPTATVSGGSTTITLSDQTKIVFQNYATLTSGNFS